MRKLAFLFNLINAVIKQIIKDVLMDFYPIFNVCSLPQGFRYRLIVCILGTGL